MSSTERAAPPRLFTPRFFLMCGFTFTVFLSLFQLLPTAPYRVLELGGSTFQAGLFLGFLTYASASSAPFTGALADRVGRRRILVVTSLAIAGFAVAYALAKSIPLLLAIVFVHGVFWSGLLSASAAYLTGLIPETRRAEGIAYWGLATIFATALAPALGLFVYRHGGWTGLCASILVLDLLMAAIAFSLEETKGEAAAVAAGPRGVRRLVELVEWRVFAVALSLFLCSFGYGGVTSFVALYAEKSGIEPRSLYFTVFSVAVLMTRPFIGRLADRVGAARVLLPCFAFVVAAFGILAIASTRPRMILSAVCFGVGFGNLYPAFVTHVLKYVKETRRGAAFGGILAAFDTGIGTGSIVLGWVIGRSGYAAAYGVAAALSTLAIPAFLVLDRKFLSGVTPR
jgi:MFS family permease